MRENAKLLAQRLKSLDAWEHFLVFSVDAVFREMKGIHNTVKCLQGYSPEDPQPQRRQVRPPCCVESRWMKRLSDTVMVCGTFLRSADTAERKKSNCLCRLWNKAKWNACAELIYIIVCYTEQANPFNPVLKNFSFISVYVYMHMSLNDS